MRKTVLFIARFDNVLKGTNAMLSKVFNMQMCPPDLAMIQNTLTVVEMDLILLYISTLRADSFAILREGLSHINIEKTPIIVVGTTEECEDFDRLCRLKVTDYLFRPTAAPAIIDKICGTLVIAPDDAVAPPPPPPASAPAAPPVAAPSAGQLQAQIILQKRTAEMSQAQNGGNTMSIVDLAEMMDFQQRSLLVVDDDGRILRAMKMLLEKSYKVSVANSGVTALAAIKRQRPDAVLLDYEMPECDGRQTLEMIRMCPETANLPVFFLTGVSDKERIQEVLKLSPQGYFLKNSPPDLILGTLDRFFAAQ